MNLCELLGKITEKGYWLEVRRSKASPLEMRVIIEGHGLRNSGYIPADNGDTEKANEQLYVLVKDLYTGIEEIRFKIHGS